MSASRWLLLHLAAAIALLSSPTGTTYGQDAANGNKPAAVVNGEVIRFAEVDALIKARPGVVPLTKAQKVELYTSALEMLIDDMLIRQYLRKNAPPPNPAEVEKEWHDLKEALSKKQQTLAEFLVESKQTEEQIRADIVSRVQWRAFLNVRFTEADLQAYYQANKVFFDKTFVQASHILVKAGPAPAERDKAQQKLLVIRQDILAGRVSFADAARKYSECPSADKGGDIGKFPYKFIVVEPFAKAAFAMKVGDISGIVPSEFGMHLIMVTDRIEGPPSSFAAVRETVRETYAQEIGLYKNIMSEQRGKSKIERATIEVLLP
jgi:parvulin-like peptidyl-prolyl isomerase